MSAAFQGVGGGGQGGGLNKPRWRSSEGVRGERSPALAFVGHAQQARLLPLVNPVSPGHSLFQTTRQQSSSPA